jgi:hypothetical protein
VVQESCNENLLRALLMTENASLHTKNLGTITFHVFGFSRLLCSRFFTQCF